MVTEAQWAYLAGLLDGEGDICLAKNGKNTTCVRIRISNTDMGIINWIVSNFGGHIGKANSNTSYGKKLCLRVGWNGKYALPILNGVIPFLQHSKKIKLAKLALEHISNEDNLDKRKALAEVARILQKGKG